MIGYDPPAPVAPEIWDWEYRMATSNKIGGALRQAWRIAKPYYFSDEKWSALGLLVVVVALSLGQVALNVRFSYWYNAFYNTLQNLDEHEIGRAHV